MNLLAFDSVQDYREILADTSFLRIGHHKWPTPGNDTMKRFARTRWTPDARYVILLNLWQRSKEPKPFTGERLVVLDTGDKPKIHQPWFDMADVYVKDNSWTPEVGKHPKVRVGCYAPSCKVPLFIHAQSLRPSHPKKWDVFFCGDMHCGRDKKLAALKPYFREKGWKCKFGNDHTYGREAYIKEMKQARIALSFCGKGKRARREWEALLCGCKLYSDPELEHYPTPIMAKEVHYTHHLDRIKHVFAEGAYRLAVNCWMQAPTIDIRMAALYMFADCKQIWNYEDVERLEREHGLR